MGDSSTVLIINQPCDEAVNWIIEKLSQVHLSVLRTFDLQDARHVHSDCPCPHHGTELCDCQMVVLLIYRGKCAPVTLIAHGSDSQTWFSVVDTPQQRADPNIEAVIRHAASVPPQPSL